MESAINQYESPGINTVTEKNVRNIYRYDYSLPNTVAQFLIDSAKGCQPWVLRLQYSVYGTAAGFVGISGMEILLPAQNPTHVSKSGNV